MAGVERQDYVLGIGVELNSSSITAFETALKERLDKAFSGLHIISPAAADAAMAVGSKISTNMESARKSIAAAGAEVSKLTLNSKELEKAWTDYDKAAGSLQRGLEQVAVKQNETVLSAKEASEKRKAIAAQETKERVDLLGIELDKFRATEVQKSAIVAEESAKRAAEQAAAIAALNEKFAANTVAIPDTYAQVAKQFQSIKTEAEDARATAKMFNDEVKRLGGVSNFQSFYGASDDEIKSFLTHAKQYGQTVNEIPSFWDKNFRAFGNHIAQWGLMTAAIEGAYVVLEQFNHGIQQASEFQIQGVMFQSYQRAARDTGANVPEIGNSQLLSEATKLASLYGDNINVVAQDIALWTKSTHDLNSAVYMTNEALKFQMASGTDLEDIYKTLTALSQQAKGLHMAPDSKELFDLSKTHEVLNMIFAASNAAGAGMHGLSEAGREAGASLNNSGGILLESLEKDTAALGKLGLSMKEMIAMNQAMITAMGNTGSAAEDSAEKMSRLVAGIMALSKQSKSNSLAKDLGLDDFKKLQEVFNGDQSHFFERFASFYGDLDTHAKNVLDTTIASQRQYELNANIVKQTLDEYKGILKAEGDKSILDDTASQMMDTLNTKTHRLQSEWSGVVQIIGSELLPLLEHAADAAAHVIPAIVAAAADKSEVRTALGSSKSYQTEIGTHVDPTNYLAFLQERARAKHVSLPGDVVLSLRQAQNPLVDPLSNPFNRNARQDQAMWGATRELAATKYGSISLLDKLGVPELDSTLASSAGFGDRIARYGAKNIMQSYALTDDIKRALNRGSGDGKVESHPQIPDPTTKGHDNPIRDVREQYADLIAEKQRMIDITKSEVDTTKTLIEIKGNSNALTARLKSNYSDEEQAIRAKQKALQEEVKSLAGKPHSQVEMADLKQQIAALSVELIKVQNESDKAGFALTEFKAKAGFSKVDTLWKKDLGDFKTGNIGLGGLTLDGQAIQANLKAMETGLPKDSQLLQEIERLWESIGTTIEEDRKKVEDFSSQSAESFSRETHADQLELGTNGLMSWQKNYIKALDAIDAKQQEFFKKYNELTNDGKDTAAAQIAAPALAAEQSWYAAAQALAFYNRNVEEAKASPMYSALSKGIDTIGTSLTDYFVSSINGDTGKSNEISSLQAQMMNIQNEKSLISSGPFAKYHTYQTKELEEQARLIQQRIKQLDEQMKHPPIVKKIFEEMEKSLVETFVKKFEDSFKQQLLDSIVKQKEVVSPQITATQANTSALNNLTNAIRSGGSSSSGGFGGGIPISFGGGSDISASSAIAAGGGGIGDSGSTSAAIGAGALAAASALPGVFSSPAMTQNMAAVSGMTLGGGSSMSGTALAANPSALGQSSAYAGFGGLSTIPAVYDSPAFGQNIANASGKVISGGGKGGFTAGKAMGVLGGAMMAEQGYQQGGFQGSAMAGLGVYSSLTSLAGMFSGGAAAAGGFASLIGAAAPYLALAVFAASMFHPHYDPSHNPDMFKDSGFAQGIANAQGQAYTDATGWVYEDSAVKSQLGGMTQLQYLDAWYNKYPGGQGLNSDGLDLWNKIGSLTGGGKGVGIGGLHQGNVYVNDAAGNQVGMSGNWQDVLASVNSETQDLYNLLSGDGSLTTPMISVNQYGGNGAASFSPWYTPGLSSEEIGAILNAPYNSPTTGNPTGGSNGYPSSPGNVNVNTGDNSMSVTNNVNVDGSTVAQWTNAYNNQRTTAGFAAYT